MTRIALAVLLLAACGRERSNSPSAAPPTPAATDAAAPVAAAADAALAAAADAAPAAAPLQVAIGNCRVGMRGTGTGPKFLFGAVGNVGPQARPPRDVSRVMIKLLSVGTGFDKQLVNRYLRRYLGRLRYCYEKQQVMVPDLRDVVRVEFDVGPEGVVTALHTRGNSQELATCVKQSVQAIIFPRPPEERSVPVRALIQFDPTDAPPEKPAPRTISRSEAAAATTALRGRIDAIRACLPPTARGAASIELTVDARGNVTGARVHLQGISDVAVSECLDAAVRLESLPVTAAGTLRCPLTVGARTPAP